MNSKTLFIFNGDYAWNCWKQEKTADDSPYLVWRENFLEGPLLSNVSDDEFDRVRAKFLHTCVPEYSEEGILRSLLNLRATLEEYNKPDCEIVLYFDCCMYDMIMLARIFSLLKNLKAEIRLFCEDVILGCAPEVFRNDITSLREVPQNIVKLYARAWECVLQGADALKQFNDANLAKEEPFLADAMRRYGEDHPADGTIGRSQKQLLEIVDSGISAFPEIFQAFDKYEKYMFLGDTHCLRILERLTEQGLLRKENASQVEKYPSFYKIQES